MKVKLHKLGLGLAASVMLFAALPAHAINKYGCIYAVDPWDKIVKDPYGRCIRRIPTAAASARLGGRLRRMFQNAAALSPSNPLLRSAKRSRWAPTPCLISTAPS